ncbi:MAG TPA: ATP-binding protein [Pyrinomonadaceae bacterium]|nr:ATP-binding protein [Pyrinomonadaceae bacterium]
MVESKPIKNPFPGPRPFETDEYTLFFGREEHSEQLLLRLQRARFLALLGNSGSGKTSLIRAGLMPALHGGMMPGADSGWRIALMRPGRDPIGNLAGELVKEGVLPHAGAGLPGDEAEAAVGAILRSGSLGMVQVAREGRLPENEKLLIFVDHFEELFRFPETREATSNADEAFTFVKLLLEATKQQELPIYVAVAMRSDFVGDCAQFQGLPEAINDGPYLIPRMTRDELKFAIVGPVRIARGRIDNSLVTRLLNEVDDNHDQLPILQHALMRTWEHWQTYGRTGEPMGIEDYEAIGTMADAISLHGDAVFNGLRNDNSRLIAERVFKALSERGSDNREVCRPTSLAKLCNIAGASEQDVRIVIDVFRDVRCSFLMPPTAIELQPKTVIDISHASLIRNWKRLSEWAKE